MRTAVGAALAIAPGIRRPVAFDGELYDGYPRSAVDLKQQCARKFVGHSTRAVPSGARIAGYNLLWTSPSIVSRTIPLPARAGGARGEIRASFARVGARTEAARVFETGGLRLRFPRAGAECEAVLVNTGGGMAGGDRARIDLALAPGARVIATTQAAEKIYRADGVGVEVAVRLAIEPGSSLVWAPRKRCCSTVPGCPVGWRPRSRRTPRC